MERITAAMRNWWKRWALALFAIVIGAVWLAAGESETIRRSRGLKLGLTVAEVDVAMGAPLWIGAAQSDGHLMSSYATVGELRLNHLKQRLRPLVTYVGASAAVFDQWGREATVEVHFRGGRVEWIRRGNEFESH
jgi:hypothetical protein